MRLKWEHFNEFRYLSCQRWSVIIPLFFYTALFCLTWSLSLPLKSSHKVESAESEPEYNLELETDKKFRPRVIAPDNLNGKDPTELLETIFIRADKDSNKLLSLNELAAWINVQVQEHISQALQENFGLFTAIDKNPRNGMISWDEYHAYFLKQKGLSSNFQDMNRADKESLMRERASWSEAARADPDHLTLDEFLAFRHPESSHATILSLVDDLLDKFDRDGDEVLTEDEYSGLEMVTQKKGDEERRRKEFRELIDKDQDGHADRRELMMYIDPKNPRHAREEAATLLALSDTNQDNNLSLQEILSKMGLFLGSKMVDTAGSFHDEF